MKLSLLIPTILVMQGCQLYYSETRFRESLDLWKGRDVRTVKAPERVEQEEMVGDGVNTFEYRNGCIVNWHTSKFILVHYTIEGNC
jgi:hypothetical protein